MIHLILLAAGNSRRFGSNKLRFSLDGKPLYRHTLDKLLSVSASYPDCHVYTVTQYEDILEELELLRDSLLGLPCEHSFCPLCNTSSAESNNITSSAIMPSDKHSGFLHPVFSPESSQGISYSIREGITCAMETEILFAEGMIPDMRNSAFFFFVADQPYMTKQTIFDFINSAIASEKPLGCVSLHGEPGNPAYFSSRYLSKLRRLSGDTGGKKIIRANMDLCYFHEIADPQELADADTPDFFTDSASRRTVAELPR